MENIGADFSRGAGADCHRRAETRDMGSGKTVVADAKLRIYDSSGHLVLFLFACQRDGTWWAARHYVSQRGTLRAGAYCDVARCGGPLFNVVCVVRRRGGGSRLCGRNHGAVSSRDHVYKDRSFTQRTALPSRSLDRNTFRMRATGLPHFRVREGQGTIPRSHDRVRGRAEHKTDGEVTLWGAGKNGFLHIRIRNRLAALASRDFGRCGESFR